MGAEALEKVSLYWLCHLPEAGALQIRRIGELAGSFREAYYIEGTQLWKKGIFKKEENAYRFDNWKREFSRLEEEYYRLSEKGIRFITPLDADYPKRLYSVYDYPMGLYIKGELPAEDRATAAVIGASVPLLRAAKGRQALSLHQELSIPRNGVWLQGFGREADTGA